MAQVIRLICGKCGKSCTLVAKNRLVQKEGDAMAVTCEMAAKVFPSMAGCDDSKLVLSKIKCERQLMPKDITLEGFPESFKVAQAAAEKQRKAIANRAKPATPPGKATGSEPQGEEPEGGEVDDPEGEDQPTETDVEDVEKD